MCNTDTAQTRGRQRKREKQVPPAESKDFSHVGQMHAPITLFCAKSDWSESYLTSPQSTNSIFDASSAAPLHLLQQKVVVITRTFILIIEAKSDLDHSVNASRKLRWLVQVEARGEKRRIQKEPDQILHCLVRIVCRRLFLQLLHDGIRWIDLHGFLWTP